MGNQHPHVRLTVIEGHVTKTTLRVPVPKIAEMRFVDEGWKPVTDRRYKHSKSDGNVIQGNQTDADGYIEERLFPQKGRKITLEPSGPRAGGSGKASSAGGEPLPALEFTDRASGSQGPIKRGDSRQNMVEQIQRALQVLGYDLGDTGSAHNGVDGVFGVKTEEAVKRFQEENKDWEGNALVRDGRVGPRTSDALNRAMVGIWYDEYETPSELTKGFRLLTLTEKAAQDTGIGLS